MNPAEPVAFGTALRFWARLGCISFGGPAGQIAIMHTELVEHRRWISEKRFAHALGYCMVLPGPEAQQLATYIGWLLHGVKGGIAAGLLFILPSLLLLIALAWAYLAFGHVGWVAAALYGIKPAVVAIVLHAAIRIAARVLHNFLLWTLALASFAALTWLQVPFPALIALAALIGWIGARLHPALIRPTIAAASSRPGQPALIDDGTPAPAHAVFSRRRILMMAAVGLLLWLLPVLALVLASSSQPWLVTMAGFFTKAALLTFGGAYAVLPYVAQASVAEHAWLSMGQMMDGLALGETTPGPLIMVVTFVGFVGGWQQGVPGAELEAGMAAALVATYFTFLPSFLFILAGGPLVESTRGLPWLAAPLAGITAAVVGVILNLGWLFAIHTFWPGGFDRGIDAAAIALTSVALLALHRFGLGIPWVIVSCGAISILASI